MRYKHNFLTLSFLFLWSAIFSKLITSTTTLKSPTTILIAVLSIAFLFYVFIKGTSKKSSMFGKILIFGGILGLVSVLVEQGRDIANIDTLIRILATITGLYLERVSPHKRLRKFMFLAIATKIEFIGITALTVLLLEQEAKLLVEPVYWYVIVGLMAASVPALALERINVYRVLVFTTTVASLILVIDVLVSDLGLIISLASILAVLWPAVTARALGRLKFF